MVQVNVFPHILAPWATFVMLFGYNRGIYLANKAIHMRRKQTGLGSMKRGPRVIVIALVLVILVLTAGAVLAVDDVAPEQTWILAERELQGGLLSYGERPAVITRVYKRRATNYFRRTHGILVATQRRVLFIGVDPKDNLAGPDAPFLLTTSEFPNDTLLAIRHSRADLLTTSGVIIERMGRKEKFAAINTNSKRLDSLITYVKDLNDRIRADAATERKLRADVAEMLKQPLYYEIKRGDALINIADRFGTIPDSLMQWNNLTSTRIRIRDTLLVKPAKH